MASSPIDPGIAGRDTADFCELLLNVPEIARGEIIVTRAPGRLDLMGGIADYSGSLVLQMPIANATHAGFQAARDNKLRVISLAQGRSPRHFAIPLEQLQEMTIQETREYFRQRPDDHWAAYVAGAYSILRREINFRPSRGATILIASTVPEGKGVSSSAALEVAAMTAILAGEGLELTPQAIALLCQEVENLVAGAPCGVMDQMTAMCGRADELLALLCQPAEIIGQVALPHELAVWGIDSGVRHAVGGSDYGTVRTAAFMGYCMIASAAGLTARAGQSPGHIEIDDERWKGYLANLSPGEFERDYAAVLPLRIRGDEFLSRYRGITDRVTSVEEAVEYPVFRATRHPIYENSRVETFREELRQWGRGFTADALGELMYQSHESYSACGLGSAATDRIVELARRTPGVFGAKITGGGSGGTVAVLADANADRAVEQLVDELARESGSEVTVISGSSGGAAQFGHIVFEK